MAYHFGKVSRWGDVGPSRLTCHRPDGFLPAQLLLRGWERVFVAEKGSVDRLCLPDDAPLLLIMRVVGKCDILRIPGSVRSRLYDPINPVRKGQMEKRTWITLSVS